MTDIHVSVLGGGQTGRRLAEDLAAHSTAGDIRFVDDSEPAVERADANGVRATHTPVTDAESAVVEAATDAEIAVLVGDNDGMNLLLAQRLRLRDADLDLVVLVNDPRNREAFGALDVETVCVAQATVAALGVQISELTPMEGGPDAFDRECARAIDAEDDRSENGDLTTDRTVG